MSKYDEKGNIEQRVTKDEEVYESKPDIFVKSKALVGDGGVIPIYAVLESQRNQLIYAWGWVLGAAIFSAWTISFTYAVLISDNPPPHHYDHPPEKTIALVNAASHVMVILTAGLIGATFDSLCWALASRPKGIPIRTFLATNKDSGNIDVGNLLLTWGRHQKWCILRYS
jgi:hypothetical protein